jgi:hypothetical protein
MNKAALVALFVGAILFAPAMVLRLWEPRVTGSAAAVLAALWIAIPVFGACGVGLLALRFLLSLRYDPNDQPLELRKQIGQRLTANQGAEAVASNIWIDRFLEQGREALR